MRTGIMKLRKTQAEAGSLGALVVLEPTIDIPFDIKRVYFTYGVDEGNERGYHAHKKLEQLLVCVFGSIEVECDDGKRREKTILSSPSEGLFIGPGTWRTLKWIQGGSVLLVLASALYDESDYIREYDSFLQLVEEGYWK